MQIEASEQKAAVGGEGPVGAEGLIGTLEESVQGVRMRGTRGLEEFHDREGTCPGPESLSSVRSVARSGEVRTVPSGAHECTDVSSVARHEALTLQRILVGLRPKQRSVVLKGLFKRSKVSRLVMGEPLQGCVR